MAYDPRPIDTAHLRLTAETRRLTELLARNTHDLWAKQRMAEGWRYGPVRDDALKEHPDLVPYEELPDSEKEYDRRTSIETIKALLSLGYSIEPPGRERASSDVDQPSPARALDEIVATLRRTERSALGSLLALWQARDVEAWCECPDAYTILAEKLLRAAEPLLAYDVVQEGLSYFPGHVRLLQLRALGLARSGASGSARDQLEELYRSGHADEETLSMLGRTHKDAAGACSDPVQAARELARAYEYYELAYLRTRGFWSGINTATLAVLLGRAERARERAREVRTACLAELDRLERDGGDRYYPLATLGEASLILGETAAAEDWYSRAAGLAHGRYGDLASTRRNARLLTERLGVERGRIEACFRIPAAVVFTGHMLDPPHRPDARFPPQLEHAVKESILARLRACGAGFGYASAACGSDILFLEAMLEQGGEVQVVLPCEKEQFVRESVEIIPGAGWRERFERILERSSVLVASAQRVAKRGVSYDYANLLLLGLARIRAEQLDTALVPLAVWDGKPGDGPGGTASTVQRWIDTGHSVDIIDLARIHGVNRQASIPGELSTGESPQAVPMSHEDSSAERPRDTGDPSPGFSPAIHGLLFADAVGFSKLTEDQVPLFVRHFLGLVAQLCETASRPPLMKNTWGDGLFFVFENVHDAGAFALDLCERVCGTDWAAKGLAGLSLRIGLHAGPVYACLDPVTRKGNFIGAHVSRAARIEPVTPPGQVYASQAFSALAMAEGVREFACDYVGQIAFAKKFGTFPLFVIRRR